jgi:hypothetical protein
VVWDPSNLTKNKVTIDYQDANSLKLWVLNRIHIYLSRDGKKWNHLWGDFEGCLTGRKIFRTSKGDTFRKHVYLRKKVNRKLLFATLIGTPKKMKDICRDYHTDVPQLETTKDAVRPYPEDFTEPQKYFNWGIFRKGINIVVIPADKIEYPAKIEKIEYWELKIYRSSLDPRIETYRKSEKEGILKKNEIPTLRSELKNKLGTCLAKYKRHSKEEDGILDIPHPKGILNWEENHCFFYGVSRDVIEQREKSDEEVTDQLNLYRMDKKGYETKTIPIPTLKDFSIEDFYNDWWRRFDTDTEIRDEIKAKNLKEDKLAAYILDRAKLNLERIFGLDDPGVEQHLRFFYVGMDKTREGAMVLAMNKAAANEEFYSSTYNYHESSSKSKANDTSLSVKRTFFATGCDSYSEEIIPKHIYIQIKEWWDKIFDAQKTEIQNSVEIEVIGFSSKLGETEDNVRLRKDRAWKSAKCLQLFFQNVEELSKTKFTLVPREYLDPLKYSIYEADWQGDKDEIPIYYGGAPEDHYPGSNLFQLHDMDFIQDVLDTSQLSVPDSHINPRDNSNNQIDDRVSLITFKKPKPKISQIAKQYIVTNTALVIHQYKLIFSIEIDGKWYVLMYVCPGLFADNYPAGFGSLTEKQEKYLVNLEISSDGYNNDEFNALYAPKYEHSEAAKPFVNLYEESPISSEGHHYYSEEEIQYSLASGDLQGEPQATKYQKKEMEEGHTKEEQEVSELPIMFLTRQKDPFYSNIHGRIRYLTKEERANYEVTIKEGKLFGGSKLLDTMGAESLFALVDPKWERVKRIETKPVVTNTWIFVMTPNGAIYAADWAEEYQKGGYYDALRFYGPAPKEIIGFNHSSLVAGEAVAAAGEFTVNNGKVKLISNKSGHYYPKPIHIYNFICELLERDPNLNLKDIKLELMTSGNRFQQGVFYNAEEFFKARAVVDNCRPLEEEEQPEPELTDGGLVTDRITRIPCLVQHTNTCGQRAAFNALKFKAHPNNPNAAAAAMANDEALRAIGPMQTDVYDDYIQNILDGNNAENIALVSSLQRVSTFVNQAGEYPYNAGEQDLDDWAHKRRINTVTLVINTVAVGAEVKPSSSKAAYGHYIAIQVIRQNSGTPAERVVAYYADSLAQGADRVDLIQRLLQALTPQ